MTTELLECNGLAYEYRIRFGALDIARTGVREIDLRTDASEILSWLAEIAKKLEEKRDKPERMNLVKAQTL